MLEKDFVPYEPSLALKELGFDEPCFGYYDNTGKLFFNTNGQPVGKDWVWEGNQIVPTDMVLAPTFSQAFRWFREKYQLHNGIYPYYDEYEFQIKDFRLPTSAPINGGLMPYEEAELACLIKLIEIIKKELNTNE